jgi:hypothetical protein
MSSAIKFLNGSLCLLVFIMFFGCLPDPHRTLRSPQVRGRVLDAQTQMPIEGARVCFTEHPEISSQTDRTGYFLLKATYNLHLASIPPEGNWPERKYWDDKITLSHAGYLDVRIDHWPSYAGADKGDILLEHIK